jgi:hypothetical protein
MSDTPDWNTLALSADLRVHVSPEQATAMGVSRREQLLNGVITVQDLDDEELARGQCRDADGSFTSRPGKKMPREIHQEMIRRLLSRGDEIWRRGYNVAIRVHLEIAADPNNSPGDRMRAAQYLIERVAGKTPERIQLAAEDPVETLFRRILADPDGLLEPAAPVREPQMTSKMIEKSTEGSDPGDG